MKNNLHINMT